MLKNNIEEVYTKIERASSKASRKKEDIKLLAVTKTVPVDVIKEAYKYGLRLFGENKVQEFLGKYEALKDLDIEWHFIGTLQTNKVKYLKNKVKLIHSVDRKALVDEISKRMERMDILIEVNVGQEQSKSGVKEEHLKELAEYVLSKPNLQLKGLMCIPPYFEDKEKVRPFFAKLRNLKEDLENTFNITLPELSMGMSHDFEVAIEEGATIIRIGTYIFGERDYNK
ncbi:MAG TPA: YggS family pyridoxal phosphate-dependent enzyme [Hydrogenobaculum sp.]|nr:YggS family pyridoxal phosphate-dependent enzyme [Hydrogenobaculum sp.]